MLGAGRRQEIVEIVEQNNGATVAELSKLFGVSRATVRRDLTRLSHQGLIERAHGGAAPNPRGRARGFPESPMLKRASIQAQAKNGSGVPPPNTSKTET